MRSLEKDIIAHNLPFLNKRGEENKKFADVTYMVGSNRQSKEIDDINKNFSEGRKPNSCFEDLLKVAKHHMVSVDQFLLADVYGSNLKPGTSYQHALAQLERDRNLAAELALVNAAIKELKGMKSRPLRDPCETETGTDDEAAEQPGETGKAITELTLVKRRCESWRREPSSTAVLTQTTYEALIGKRRNEGKLVDGLTALVDYLKDHPHGCEYQKPNIKHAGWAFDANKISLIYAQMHHAATKNPNDTIQFDFYDDKDSLLKVLEVFYTDYPELIPTNVTLRVHLYNGGEDQLYFEQPGQGLADLDYYSSVRKMKKLAIIHKAYEGGEYDRYRRETKHYMENAVTPGRLLLFDDEDNKKSAEIEEAALSSEDSGSDSERQLGSPGVSHRS